MSKQINRIVPCSPMKQNLKLKQKKKANNLQDIPDSEDAASPSFSDNFMQDSRIFETIGSTKFLRGTVSITDIKAR